MGVSHMARGGHELPKVLLGPAMPYPSTVCGFATPETAFWAFQGWSAPRVGGLRSSSIHLDTPFPPPVLGPQRELGLGAPVVVNPPL
jgi:hypothetical protein